MSKFSKLLTELYDHNMSVVLFLDDNLSKCRSFSSNLMFVH